MAFNYKESCEKAIALGYKPHKNTNAYSGIVFVKDDLKWIHSIDDLKRELGVTTDEQLIELGYNVSDYYEYAGLSLNETLARACQNELKEIFDEFSDAAVFIDGCSAAYLCDGVYITEDGELIDTKG